MTHAAKRIAHQCYQYRGQRIEAINDCDGKLDHWNIYQGDDLIAIDAANTLRECKIIIDEWKEQ